MNIKQFIILVLLIVNFALSKKLRSNAASKEIYGYGGESAYGYGGTPYGAYSVYGGGSQYGNSGYGYGY